MRYILQHSTFGRQRALTRQEVIILHRRAVECPVFANTPLRYLLSQKSRLTEHVLQQTWLPGAQQARSCYFWCDMPSCKVAGGGRGYALLIFIWYHFVQIRDVQLQCPRYLFQRDNAYRMVRARAYVYDRVVGKVRHAAQFCPRYATLFNYLIYT